jgi:hypothetical protein
MLENTRRGSRTSATVAIVGVQVADDSAVPTTGIAGRSICTSIDALDKTA